MKNATILSFLLFFGMLHAQTPFAVTGGAKNSILSGVEVFRNHKSVGKTDQNGKITISGILKGDSILFNFPNFRSYIYVARANNPRNMNKISMVFDASDIENGLFELQKNLQSLKEEIEGKSPSTDENAARPQFPGGPEEMTKWIAVSTKYPESAKTKQINASCTVFFNVAEDGTIENASILAEIDNCPECNAEALRVAQSMPKWVPQKINDKPVDALATITVYFKSER